MSMQIAPVQRVATQMRLAFVRARDTAVLQRNPTRWLRQGITSVTIAEHAGSGMMPWR